jgi:hypothetical protein
LHECRHAVVALFGQSFTNAAIRGVAGHQPQGQRSPHPTGQGGHFRQPEIQKRPSWQCLDERFDDAAHARGHAARQND